MSSSKDRFPDIPIPDEVRDPNTNKRYTKGKFLGKGGFAKCFEFTDMETSQIYAAKIVPKCLLAKPQQKDKMKMEIDLHKRMDHPHIVKFYSYFDDANFIFIVLELCKRRSLMELHKRRKAVTEEETRYFINQILLAVNYIHDHNVIHRDLKLGNLFLNEQIQVKIGDFGLATRMERSSDRRKTICGTPNYIAPEVLQKKGHSYEVDIWAIGCILYTLLVGKPPFETLSLKETYERIKNNQYQIPSKIGNDAASLIRRLLCADPSKRPKIKEILHDPFMTRGLLPKILPSSCLTLTPRLQALHQSPRHNANNTHDSRSPSNDVMTNENGRGGLQSRKNSGQVGNGRLSKIGAPEINGSPIKPVTASAKMNHLLPTPSIVQNEEDIVDASHVHPLKHLQDLKSMLQYIEKIHDDHFVSNLSEDFESPDLIPIYWVSKWVDYSDKYGLSYQLCDGSIGVLYNDNSRMILFQDEENIQFIDDANRETFHALSDYPSELKKKITLLKYFRSYMSEHLLKTGGDVERPVEEGVKSRLPFLRTWFRTKNAIVLSLSNGTVQINFFQCHTKLILCPIMQAISYIDEDKNFRVFPASVFRVHGVITKHLFSRLKYALLMIDKLFASVSPQNAPQLTARLRPQSSNVGAAER